MTPSSPTASSSATSTRQRSVQSHIISAAGPCFFSNCSDAPTHSPFASRLHCGAGTAKALQAATPGDASGEPQVMLQEMAGPESPARPARARSAASLPSPPDPTSAAPPVLLRQETYTTFLTSTSTPARSNSWQAFRRPMFPAPSWNRRSRTAALSRPRARIRSARRPSGPLPSPQPTLPVTAKGPTKSRVARKRSRSRATCAPDPRRQR